MIKILTILLFLTTSPVLSHDWSRSVQYVHDWYSNTGCCGGHDCHPIPCEQLSDNPNGSITWHDKPDHTWDFEKNKVRPSQDNQCHACILNGLKADIPMCVFIQQSY